MLSLLKNILGISPATDYLLLVNKSAQIIDVRTPAEYQSGHVKGSINIPLNNLSQHLSKINKNKPVITCCASGMRSASAKEILRSNGFTEVYNGGGWAGLQNKINPS